MKPTETIAQEVNFDVLTERLKQQFPAHEIDFTSTSFKRILHKHFHTKVVRRKFRRWRWPSLMGYSFSETTDSVSDDELLKPYAIQKCGTETRYTLAYTPSVSVTTVVLSETCHRSTING